MICCVVGAVLSSSERNSELMMPHDEQQILNADHALATLANTLGNNPNNPSDNYCFPPIDDDRAMVSHVRRELKRELKEAISLSHSLNISYSFCSNG